MFKYFVRVNGTPVNGADREKYTDFYQELQKEVMLYLTMKGSKVELIKVPIFEPNEDFYYLLNVEILNQVQLLAPVFYSVEHSQEVTK